MASETPAAPAAEPKAAAPVTPAAPASPAPAAAPAPAVAPAKAAEPAAAPAAPAAAGEKSTSLLDAAKAPGAKEVSPVEAAQNAAIALYDAVDAWQKNPTPENKALADKALADSKAAAEAAKAAVPDPAKAVTPEKYELKPIEGVTFDQAALEAFTPIAKKLNLSNDAVNELVAFQAAQVKAQEAADLKAWTAHQENQKQEAIKGLGAKWQEELAFAATARDRFFSKEAVEALNFAGVANNIHILRAFITMGRQISPEKLVDGAPANAENSEASKLFPSMASK